MGPAPIKMMHLMMNMPPTTSELDILFLLITWKMSGVNMTQLEKTEAMIPAFTSDYAANPNVSANIICMKPESIPLKIGTKKAAQLKRNFSTILAFLK